MIRVTEILDYLTEPELLKWYLDKGKAFCKKISDEALYIGKNVDQMIQDDIRGIGYAVPNNDPKIANCMSAWELFKKDRPDFVKSITAMQEELVWNDIVGHPDFMTETPKRWGIVDLKCSSSIRPRYFTQTAQYSEMKRLSAKFTKPRYIAVLRLGKDSGLYEYKEIDDEGIIKYEVNVFEAHLMLFKHNMSIREILRRQLEMEVLGE